MTKFKADYQVVAALVATAPKGAEIVWASRCTRWDVYPQQQPVVLAAHTWEGWFLPQPDGSWYKVHGSYNVCGALGSRVGAWERIGTLDYYVLVQGS